VQQDLDVLQAAGNILLYTVNDAVFLQVVNWHTYQRDAEWLSASIYPAPDGWTDHARYHGTGNKIVTLNWDTRLTTLPLPSPLPCHDVNGDVNDDGDVNGNGDGDVDVEHFDDGAPDPVSSLEAAFTQATKLAADIPDPQKAKDAFFRMSNAGVTPEDIAQAVSEMAPKYKITSPLSVVTPSIMVMTRRRSTDHHRFASGKYADFGAH
jgi:hypothetical protein